MLKKTNLAQIGMQTKKRNRFSRVLLRLLFVLVLVFYALFAVEYYTRPTIRKVIEYEAKRYATESFNTAVIAHVEEQSTLYQELYQIDKDSTGAPVAVYSDVYAMNTVKNGLTETVMETLYERQYETHPVRIGKLVGLQMLSGWGPTVNIAMRPESYVVTQIYDTWEEAGTNQTKLNVYASFSIQMNVIMAGYTQTVTVENDVLLTQSVLLGKVPDVNL